MNMMKFAFIIFLLLLLACSHSSQNKNVSREEQSTDEKEQSTDEKEQSTDEKEQSTGEVVVTQRIGFIGRIPELPSPTMRCGDSAIASVYKFEITKWLNGELDVGVVRVIIPCPELKGDSFFEENGAYRITSTSDLGEAEGYTVVNDYESEELPMLWGQEIEKL